jgi:predicted cupin superfamily sugar epimerase
MRSGMNNSVREIITALDLQPLPSEGGYFRQTWRTPSASAILYLITSEEFSALHRIAQDEIWHHYAGDDVEHVQFGPGSRSLRRTRMGPEVLEGEVPQVLVPAGNWQGAHLSHPMSRAREPRGFALLGCTVSPPWNECGFELASRDSLLAEFAGYGSLIRALTR